MVPALLTPIAKIVGSAGLWTGAQRLASRAANWLGRNTGRAGASAGGVIGGLGIGNVLDSLGIEDNQFRTVAGIGLVLAAIFAVGQVFDIQLGGS